LYWRRLLVRRQGDGLCDISGYGADGPYREKKAYDLLIQSESGFLSITGSPGEPAKAGCSIADIAAGMYAYSNILSALILRGRTGKGCRIDVSMLESMVEWMGYPLYYAIGIKVRRLYPARRTRQSTRTARSWREMERRSCRVCRTNVNGKRFANACLSSRHLPATRASTRISNDLHHAMPCER
jgi:crotonobetainyl-CoA:carnitine CoA-transferase CaiB-like acyl-CoA transferase